MEPAIPSQQKKKPAGSGNVRSPVRTILLNEGEYE